MMDLQIMTEEETLPKIRTKKRHVGRSKYLESLRHTLSEYIDQLHPGSHPGGASINIAARAIAHTSVNTNDSVTLGQEQLQTYESS